MPNLSKISFQSGQTLVEIVVGIGVITMVLVGLVSAVNFSLSNIQFSRNKALATKYAQQAIEWLRKERDVSWSIFNTQAPDAGQIYCISVLPLSVTAMTVGGCTIETINDGYNLFYREVQLTGVPTDDRVLILMTVRWSQGSRPVQVQLNTTLTRW